MTTAVLLEFVYLFVRVFYVLLLTRVVLSWFASPDNQLYGWVAGLTEPVLAPIRRLLPAQTGLDLSPLVAFVVLQLIETGVRSLIRG